MRSTGSEALSLNGEDLLKIGKGAVIAVGGALLTYLESAVPGIDFGVWTPIVVAANSALINIGRKLIMDYSGKKK